jgi:competence protein ComEC
VPRPAWLGIGAAAGALAVAWPGPLPAVLAGAAMLILALATRAARQRAVSWLLPVATGVLAVAMRDVAAGPAPAPSAVIPTGAGPWTAVVVTVSAPRDGSRPAVIRLEGGVPGSSGTAVGASGAAGGPPVLIAATLPWYPPVVPNDRIEVEGRIRPPPESEYGDYLASIGAVGTLRAQRLAVLPPAGTIERTFEGLRRESAEGLNRAMPEPEAGLAAGVLLGLRDRVDRDVAADFTTAGASHVVAISGWNIAIVASTIGGLAGALHRRRRSIVIAAAIVAYVVFVGPSASVVRAGAMAGVVLLARELGRPGSAAAALGWAVAILLLLDPETVSDAGFRLSVLATAGILAWGSSFSERLAGADPGRPRRWVAEILGVSLAAQVATLPIVLLDFGRLSLISPAVNLVVVPLVPAAMAAGVVALLAGLVVGAGVPAIVATLVGLPAWVLYAAMVWATRLGADVPLASLELLPPWNVIAAGVSIAGIAAAARWNRRVRVRSAPKPAVVAAKRKSRTPAPNRSLRLVAATLSVAIVGLTLVVVYRPDGVARVTVLDVGQGDGILVEGGRGGRMVVDGGPDPGRLLIALDERLPPWDRRIDILVLTHPHEDHVAGLALLLQRYRIGRVYEPGMIGPGPGYRAWSEVLAAGGTLHGRLSTGDRLSLDAIQLRVLWPDPNRVPERPPDGGTSINNVSIVLLGEVAGHRFLLAGDIEEGVDPELVARGLPNVDLLKVAHHGSRTASTEAFLRAVRPRVAVASAGAGNPYGHPAPATIERLEELAGRVYRTDTDGAVEVSFDGAAVRVRTTGGRPVKPRATPTQKAASAGGGSAAASNRPLFLCGMPSSSPGVIPPPTAPEAPRPAQVVLGPPRQSGGEVARWGVVGQPAMGDEGPAIALGYDRGDGNGPYIDERTARRNGSPRLLLGRRRVWPRGRDRRVPGRREPVSGRPARALAARDGSWRARPPPR